MAIYHLCIKTISRSAGRSATAAIAYRAGEKVTDERTGLVHDYTRRSGIDDTELFLPENSPTWAEDRATLWNAAEMAEKRKNSTVAREFEVALPAELSRDQRLELVREFAGELVKRHGMAVDVALHEPGREGDKRNYHAHILCSTRRLTPEGFTEKTRELDDRKTGEVDYWRARWAEIANIHLERAGIESRVDHRSLSAQGTERVPQIHLGPNVVQMERRHIRTDRGSRNRGVNELNRQFRVASAEIINLVEVRKELAARLALPDDLASLEVLWQAEIDKRLPAIQARAGRIVPKLEKKIAYQSLRLTQHNQQEPRPPRLFARLRGKAFFEKHDLWQEMEWKIRYRWRGLNNRLEKVKKFLQPSLSSVYPSKAEILAVRQARKNKPELAGKLDLARTKKREGDTQRRMENMRERDRKQGHDRGMGR